MIESSDSSRKTGRVCLCVNHMDRHKVICVAIVVPGTIFNKMYTERERAAFTKCPDRLSAATFFASMSAVVNAGVINNRDGTATWIPEVELSFGLSPLTQKYTAAEFLKGRTCKIRVLKVNEVRYRSITLRVNRMKGIPDQAGEGCPNMLRAGKEGCDEAES
jgi:hypothetical protein